MLKPMIGGGPSGLRGANAEYDDDDDDDVEEGGGPSGLRGPNAEYDDDDVEEGGGPSGLRGANTVEVVRWLSALCLFCTVLSGAIFSNIIVVYNLT